jgi:hypothetical protein
MVREDGRGDRVLLVERLGEVRDNLRVGEGPCVPGLVPGRIEIGGEKIRLEDVGDRVLR